ncbi:MAG TPA: hypothetical protein VFU55_05015 [Terracidiphilus sp.]|nr:hypothetical protein [Terracidiphilus sp.]
MALVLALCVPAMVAMQAAARAQDAQGQPSSSSSATETQQTPPKTVTESNGVLTVQARIRQRRAQRRAQEIHDTYAHPWEVFVGTGFLRFTPGPHVQRAAMYSWDTAVTRYWNEKLGLTVDGRGYYGTAYVGLNPYNVTRPAVSNYGVLAGPTYRFILHPKYSISGRAMAGWALGNFSSDTNGFGAALLGLYPDGNSFAMTGSLIGEANISPTTSLRLGGDYYGTGFGSTLENSFGYSIGVVYRFGKF